MNAHLFRRPPDLCVSLGPVQSARRPSDLLGADWRLALRSQWFAYHNRFVVMGTVAVSRFRPRGAAAVASLGGWIYRLAIRGRRVSGTVVRLRVIRWSAAVCSCDHGTTAGFIHTVLYNWDRKNSAGQKQQGKDFSTETFSHWVSVSGSVVSVNNISLLSVRVKHSQSLTCGEDHVITTGQLQVRI